MAVEADEALKDQTVRIIRPIHIFIYSIQQFQRNLWQPVKPKKRNHLRYCTDARARMETDILE